MKVTPAVIRQEFIGLWAKVVRSLNPSYVGIAGKVVDETRNILIIKQEDEKKMVIKEISVFHFKFPDGTIVEIDGRNIVGRPEDRLKKRIKRRW